MKDRMAMGLLAAISILSIAIRLFPLMKYGSVIHEFDPHFNYRVAKLLSHEGSMTVRDWFDDRVWYPLGRSVGETLYPGLMAGAVAIQWISQSILRIPIDTRLACVLLSPLFAALTSIALYVLTKLVTGRTSSALTAALLLGISPAYISRSTAGSFDNEGIAIFLLISTFAAWVASVSTGSQLLAATTALFYFAMVVSWGGYVFIINLIPLHVVVLVVSGRYSSRLYVAYSTFYPLATLLAMQVPFVGFNALLQAESTLSHVVFLGLQVVSMGYCVVATFPKVELSRILPKLIMGLGLFVLCLLIVAMTTGRLGWSDRSLTLLDPTYASKFMPIVASVGEHQPTAWATFYLQLGPLLLVTPLGLYYCFTYHDEGSVFMILYSVSSFYFAGIMVRLLLTAAPAMCFLSGVGISYMIEGLFKMTLWNINDVNSEPSIKKKPDARQEREAQERFWYELASVILSRLKSSFHPTSKSLWTLRGNDLPDVLLLVIVALTILLFIHLKHCVNVTYKAYSSTSMLQTTWNKTSQMMETHDELREAYWWLRMNTDPHAKILSWWDYGYQLSALANRTVYVDNNTWNTTHIATVGRILSSSETQAAPILKSWDVDYIIVLFGGKSGIHGDDLDKLPWMVRIAQGEYPNQVLESEFLVDHHHVVSPENATSAMQQSLVYKLSYYEFGSNRDENRGQNMTFTNPITLDTIEHAYTTSQWYVRIYRVLKQSS